MKTRYFFLLGLILFGAGIGVYNKDLGLGIIWVGIALIAYAYGLCMNDSDK